MPGLSEYLTSLSGDYSDNLLRLFAACSNYGADMHRVGEKRGLLVVSGNLENLISTIGNTQRLENETCGDLIRKYGIGILLDPERTLELFDDLGKRDIDGAVFFDPYGNLVGVGAYLNSPDIDAVNGELGVAMRIKGNNGHDIGTKHLSALYATKNCPVEALATSESSRHTTMAMRSGRVVRPLVFDPATGLYGSELIKHLNI